MANVFGRPARTQHFSMSINYYNIIIVSINAITRNISGLARYHNYLQVQEIDLVNDLHVSRQYAAHQRHRPPF